MFFKKKDKQPTQTRAKMEPAELLEMVGVMAKQGMTQKQITKELGFSTTITLNNRLMKASQATGKPVPAFSRSKKGMEKKRVETVEVKKRGKGEAFGVNIPQEPLDRVGAEPGSKFKVKASKGRIALTVQ